MGGEVSPDWKRIGARARARGYRFEKHVEQTLDWQRVPMSGSAGSAFGAGDVIDGYINGAGYWLAECKMRTGESVSVDGKWVAKARKDAEKTGRFVVIITGTKHEGTQQKKGQVAQKAEAWVFLDAEAIRFLMDRITHTHELGATAVMVVMSADDTLRTTTTSKTGGFCVRRSWLDKRPGIERVDLRVTGPDGSVAHWFMWSLDYFAKVVKEADAYVVNTHRQED